MFNFILNVKIIYIFSEGITCKNRGVWTVSKPLGIRYCRNPSHNQGFQGNFIYFYYFERVLVKKKYTPSSFVLFTCFHGGML